MMTADLADQRPAENADDRNHRIDSAILDARRINRELQADLVAAIAEDDASPELQRARLLALSRLTIAHGKTAISRSAELIAASRRALDSIWSARTLHSGTPASAIGRSAANPQVLLLTCPRCGLHARRELSDSSLTPMHQCGACGHEWTILSPRPPSDR
jgi:hypothetical protein